MKQLFTLGAILLYLLSGQLSGQQIRLVQDTIYDLLYVNDDRYILYYKDSLSFVVDQNGLQPFEKFERGFYVHRGKKVLIKKAEGYHLLNDDLSMTLLENFHFEALSQEMRFKGPFIFYTQRDSLFIYDSRTTQTRFIMEDVFPMLESFQYIILRGHYDQGNFYYLIDQDKLKKLPADYEYPGTNNGYFLGKTMYSPDEDKSFWHLKDLKLKDVVSHKERYDEKTGDNDWLFLSGSGKPLKAFYKGKDAKLPSDIVEASSSEFGNTRVWVLKNNKRRYGLMSATGEMLYEAKYKKIYVPFTRNKITLRGDGECILVEGDGSEIIRGEYDDMVYLFEDRFAVLKNRAWAVIDRAHNIVIPYQKIYGKMSVYNRKDLGQKLILYRRNDTLCFYDYYGQEIVRWKGDRRGKRFKSSQYPLGYLQNMILSMDKEKAQKINPSSVWVHLDASYPSRPYRLINAKGDPLSPWYKHIRETNTPGLFIVQSEDGKYGLLQVE